MLRIAYIDYKEHYIYDLDILMASVISVAYNVYFFAAGASLKGGICGFAVGYVIFAVTKQVYGEEAFGFGDVLLLGVLGLFFGFPAFLHYFAITIMLVGLVASGFLLYDKSLAKKAVPMAPIFVAGGFLHVWTNYPTVETFIFRTCYGMCHEINGLINLLVEFCRSGGY